MHLDELLAVGLLVLTGLDELLFGTKQGIWSPTDESKRCHLHGFVVRVGFDTATFIHSTA